MRGSVRRRLAYLLGFFFVPQVIEAGIGAEFHVHLEPGIFGQELRDVAVGILDVAEF